jgi:hypothetical protein
MGKSVKLTDGSYIDAEGVYDANLKKSQKELNQRVTFTEPIQSLNMSYGFTDSRYLYLYFHLDSSKATGLTEGCDGIIVNFSSTGINLMLHDAETKVWKAPWHISKDT